MPSTRQPPILRPGWRFLLAHPAHAIALGFGSGLAPKAPGTFGTLWAWGVFVLLEHLLTPRLGPLPWTLLIALGTVLGVWACTRCAQHLGVADPGAIVWDEVLAFWGVLAVAGSMAPTGGMGPVEQAALFGLFRFFDAAKPGPVGWVDRHFKPVRPRPDAPIAIGWRQGVGILADDFVAAGCTLLLWALWLRLGG